MRFATSQGFAHCAHCSGEQFEPVDAPRLLLEDLRLFCVACERQYTYGELLRQLRQLTER